MKKSILTGIVLLALTSSLYASQNSVITDVEGSACSGDDKSRKETELLARKDATRLAAEYAATYVKSETVVKDSILEKDLINAYANAKVTVLQELDKSWYKDPASGDCFRIKLKAEITPDQKIMERVTENPASDDPAGTLNVKVWTDKKEYGKGQMIKVFLKSNRPFYGRVVYNDADGAQVQLLPNPYRKENYFNGGVVYELPGNGDHYDLEVTPPFGKETVTVYASTAQLGEIETTATGGVYAIKTKPVDVATGTRGVRITAKGSGPAAMPPTAGFAEAMVEVTTAK